MVDVWAEIEVTLFDDIWDFEKVAAAHDVLSAFRVESIRTDPDDPSKATFSVKTNFDDPEATAETAAYCLQEDLEDAGFFLMDIEVLDGYPRLV